MTGAAGFLARHLLPQLLATGARVTGLVRARPERLPPDVRPAIGDCRDAEAMKCLLKGQDIVIHLAGTLFGANWQDYLAANGEMARNLAAASQDASRIIQISSLAAAGPCAVAPGRGESETPAPVSAYGWSKLLAEQILAGSLGDRLVILRPPIIYGSGDRGLLPLFKSAKLGFGVGPADFPISIIHASDTARACLLVCDQDASGIYHLSDGKIHQMDDVCKAMGIAQGRRKVRMLRPPRILMRLSANVAPVCAKAMCSLCRFAGRPAPGAAQWNPDKYRESVQKGWLSDNSRISEAGFQPAYNLETGMAEAVAGYRAEGWL